MGFDALSDRSKSVERARRRNSHGTEFPQEARMGSRQGKADSEQASVALFPDAVKGATC